MSYCGLIRRWLRKWINSAEKWDPECCVCFYFKKFLHRPSAIRLKVATYFFTTWFKYTYVSSSDVRASLTKLFPTILSKNKNPSSKRNAKVTCLIGGILQCHFSLWIFKASAPLSFLHRVSRIKVTKRHSPTLLTSWQEVVKNSSVSWHVSDGNVWFHLRTVVSTKDLRSFDYIICIFCHIYLSWEVGKEQVALDTLGITQVN